MSEAEDFWAEVARLTQGQEAQPIFYRLYYDDQGNPLFYSQEDLLGNYIDIDQATYAQSSRNVRVVDGRLVLLDTGTGVGKLRPRDSGTPCHPKDVSVVVDPVTAHTKWKKTYEN
jgi:hypothetical protein